ncbi:DUF2867 domain-containing protein [Fulvivirga sp. 29W222]|uniref:DUF2867 domain-containing protein n=1 Tax=Fulvivirga marina TaxID=2494733 RepID=A0A937KBD5_9BACT|nr:DUF2867 domain-containing protein [Fulvivirga marina]MBL6446746.1 DUF2867 domain-containing protein [Fulvivirga marina]
MNIEKVYLPKESILANTNYDYADSYKSEVNHGANEVDSVAVGKAFFSSSPKWITYLFDLRNRLVSIFGLKTSDQIKDKEEILNNFKGNPGEQLGLFKVYSKTDNELILGEDDKHLDFRVSLLLDTIAPSKRSLTISTIVKYNNRFGKLYFLLVKPFHKLIVPAMLKEIIKHIEMETTTNIK